MSEKLIEKKVQLKDFLDAAKPEITADFFNFLTDELQKAETERSVDQIKSLAIMKLETEADKIFWRILKIIIDGLL